MKRSTPFYGKDELNKVQENFDKSLSGLSPERQAEVNKNRAEVQELVDYENYKMDLQFQAEAQMRAATGLSHSDAEDLMMIMKDKVQRGQLKVGQTYSYKSKTFVWTPYNTVVLADLYIASLQDAVVRVTDAVAAAPENVTNLGFLDLIKLAFKRFFKRG
jgi:hypothetical protein